MLEVSIVELPLERRERVMIGKEHRKIWVVVIWICLLHNSPSYTIMMCIFRYYISIKMFLKIVPQKACLQDYSTSHESRPT